MPDSNFSNPALFSAAATPGTPPANTVYLYAKTDGNFYKKDSSGSEVVFAAGAGVIDNTKLPLTGGTLTGPLSGTTSAFATSCVDSTNSFAVIATPASNPPAGRLFLYAKADGNLYTKDSNGTETAIRAGTVGLSDGGTGATTRQGAINALAGSTTSGQFLRGDGSNITMSALSACDLTGTVAISQGGTGATTSQAAINTLAGSTALGQYLRGDGSNVTMSALSASDLAGTVAFSAGGTGATTRQAAINALAGSTTSGQFLRGNGSNICMSSILASDIPTLNQNTTGTASNVTGTVALSSGGTGATTRQAAINALAGSTTSGSFLRGDGSNISLSGIQVSDVPTLNQNTTGTASNVTGTVAIANGGTGQTSQQGAINALVGSVTSGLFLRGNGVNAVMSQIGPSDIPTLNQNTTGTASNVTGTVAIANGGTGATTRQAALNALVGSTTSGSFLRGDGTNVSLASLSACDLTGSFSRQVLDSSVTSCSGEISIGFNSAYPSGSACNFSSFVQVVSTCRPFNTNTNSEYVCVNICTTIWGSGLASAPYHTVCVFESTNPLLIGIHSAFRSGVNITFPHPYGKLKTNTSGCIGFCTIPTNIVIGINSFNAVDGASRDNIIIGNNTLSNPVSSTISPSNNLQNSLAAGCYNISVGQRNRFGLGTDTDQCDTPRGKSCNIILGSNNVSLGGNNTIIGNNSEAYGPNGSSLTVGNESVANNDLNFGCVYQDNDKTQTGDRTCYFGPIAIGNYNTATGDGISVGNFSFTGKNSIGIGHGVYSSSLEIPPYASLGWITQAADPTQATISNNYLDTCGRIYSVRPATYWGVYPGMLVCSPNLPAATYVYGNSFPYGDEASTSIKSSTTISNYTCAQPARLCFTHPTIQSTNWNHVCNSSLLWRSIPSALVEDYYGRVIGGGTSVEDDVPFYSGLIGASVTATGITGTKIVDHFSQNGIGYIVLSKQIASCSTTDSKTICITRSDYRNTLALSVSAGCANVTVQDAGLLTHVSVGDTIIDAPGDSVIGTSSGILGHSSAVGSSDLANAGIQITKMAGTTLTMSVESLNTFRFGCPNTHSACGLFVDILPPHAGTAIGRNATLNGYHQALALGSMAHPVTTNSAPPVAAGGATALPASPKTYLPVLVNGIEYFIPLYQ